MDITKLTETELKALAYEQLVISNNAQRNITAIEQEIAKRAQQPAPIEETPDAA